MIVYLGLGSNLGDRRLNLETGVRGLLPLCKNSSLRVSALYEKPALLPRDANPSWSRPFLNICVEFSTDLSPEELFLATQQLERSTGRSPGPRWAPRALDIDLLICGDQVRKHPNLQIPHAGIASRAFVLDPLKDLNLKFLKQAREHPQHAPIWMAALNLTPDSFSDGGRFAAKNAFTAELERLDGENIGILDIGGESTRPGATPLSWQEEWPRIQFALQQINEQFQGRLLRPLVSVDTRHFETAVRAVEIGADMLNDVSGMADFRLVELAKESGCSYVLTHSLGVPANAQRTLDQNSDVVEQVKSWFARSIETLLDKGVRPEKIILDPGVGFGKTALQSQILLKNLDAFYEFNLPMMVGHSRKSFLAPVSPAPPQERDPESIGVSLALMNLGVDILRVHNPLVHKRAGLGWSHARKDHSPPRPAPQRRTLQVTPIHTKTLRCGDDLSLFVIEHLKSRPPSESDLIVVTSKIVSLSESRVVGQEIIAKDKLIRREADHDLGEVGYGCRLTVKHGLFIPSAGIDESNSESGDFILFPLNPFASAHKLLEDLKRHFLIRDLGVLITDSHTLPLRQGVTGIALAYAGFRGVRNLIGQHDLFGRQLKMTKMDLADGLAAAAVLMMGEANESCPLAVIENAPLEFVDQTSPAEIQIPVEQDLYYPLYRDRLTLNQQPK